MQLVSGKGVFFSSSASPTKPAILRNNKLNTHARTHNNNSSNNNNNQTTTNNNKNSKLLFVSVFFTAHVTGHSIDIGTTNSPLKFDAVVTVDRCVHSTRGRRLHLLRSAHENRRRWRMDALGLGQSWNGAVHEPSGVICQLRQVFVRGNCSGSEGRAGVRQTIRRERS